MQDSVKGPTEVNMERLPKPKESLKGARVFFFLWAHMLIHLPTIYEAWIMCQALVCHQEHNRQNCVSLGRMSLRDSGTHSRCVMSSMEKHALLEMESIGCQDPAQIAWLAKTPSCDPFTHCWDSIWDPRRMKEWSMWVLGGQAGRRGSRCACQG